MYILKINKNNGLIKYFCIFRLRLASVTHI